MTRDEELPMQEKLLAGCLTLLPDAPSCTTEQLRDRRSIEARLQRVSRELTRLNQSRGQWENRVCETEGHLARLRACADRLSRCADGPDIRPLVERAFAAIERLEARLEANRARVNTGCFAPGVILQQHGRSGAGPIFG